MMIRDYVTSASAAALVGYETPSQLNREFKRLFGRKPGEKTGEMCSAFALMEPAKPEGAAAMH